MKTINSLIFLVPFLSHSFLFAHDFWIEPATFLPPLDKPLEVRVFVGDGFAVEKERAFEKGATPRLELIGKTKTNLLSDGKEGETPYLRATIAKSGHHWLVLERERKTLRLEAEKFNEYLAEEGLERILDQRRLAKEDQKPGRERYSRYLKCLLRAGDKGDDAWRQTCSCRLEIVPLADPYQLKPGDRLRVRVLFEGKPLPATQIVALHKTGEKVAKQTLKTNDAGEAEMKATSSGTWMLRLVHMRRCPDAAEGDWESFWASLTFAMP